jgi:transcriptional regulator GlxA family with amidase domain
VVDQTHVIDQQIITCPGGTAIQLAAELIGRHCGKARAKKGLDYLLVPEAPAASPVKESSNNICSHDNRWVEAAVTVMNERLSTPCSIKELSSIIGNTERQLNRVFSAYLHVAPATYWRNLRLDRARELLLNTSLKIT